jgi:hypothetical protein
MERRDKRLHSPGRSRLVPNRESLAAEPRRSAGRFLWRRNDRRLEIERCENPTLSPPLRSGFKRRGLSSAIRYANLRLL